MIKKLSAVCRRRLLGVWSVREFVFGCLGTGPGDQTCAEKTALASDAYEMSQRAYSISMQVARGRCVSVSVCTRVRVSADYCVPTSTEKPVPAVRRRH